VGVLSCGGVWGVAFRIPLGRARNRPASRRSRVHNAPAQVRLTAVAPPEDAPTLYGERVVLRPLRQDDIEPLNAILATPEVRSWWGTDPTVDDQDAFTILVEGAIAGWVGWYEETDPDYRHGGLDIFLSPDFHGRGLGRDALLAAAGWLIEGRGHHRLIIDPSAANERAIRTYESVGFRAVGVMRRYERGPDGEWHDGLLMDLLAEELAPN
jgi:aminoglycoside 6'-N-acetyltransferase